MKSRSVEQQIFSTALHVSVYEGCDASLKSLHSFISLMSDTSWCCFPESRALVLITPAKYIYIQTAWIKCHNFQIREGEHLCWGSKLRLRCPRQNRKDLSFETEILKNRANRSAANFADNLLNKSELLNETCKYSSIRVEAWLASH